MTRLELFDIVYSNGHAVYNGGQVVQGEVVVQLAESMTIRGIRILFHGEGNVKFRKRVHGAHHNTGRSHGRNDEYRTYSKCEVYLHEEMLLVGRYKQNPGGDMELPAGRHVFPFSFQLPLGLPSSLEGQHGAVRYWGSATIDRPMTLDKTVDKNFTVILLMDLSQDPRSVTPVQSNESKTFGCLCCTSGPLSASVQLNKTAFVPGEVLVINATIDNKSNKEMTSSHAVLTMETTYIAHMEKEHDSQTIASLVHGPIKAGDVHEWAGDQMVIPAVPQSYQIGCNVIDIRYRLELQVMPPGLSFRLIVPFEIVIGAIPNQAQPIFHNPQAQAMPPEAMMAPGQGQPMSLQNMGQPTAPPYGQPYGQPGAPFGQSYGQPGAPLGQTYGQPGAPLGQAGQQFGEPIVEQPLSMRSDTKETTEM